MSDPNVMLEELEQNGMQAPSFLRENEKRRAKWAHLTDDLDDYQRLCLETMLENTQGWVNETTMTGNVGTFTTYSYPLIRRVMPSLFANELVSVQPIPMPTGMVFYLDFEYGDAFNRDGAPVVAAGDRVDLQANFNPLYSGGAVRGEILFIGDGSIDSAFVNYFPFTANSELVYVNGNLLTAGVHYVADAATGEIDLDAGSDAFGAPDLDDVVTVDYQMDPAEGGLPRQIDLRISSDSVYAETKKLRAQWTIEASQDLQAYHGLDAESEIMTVVGNQVKREIDQSILGDLRVAANATVGGAGNVNWSATIAPDYNGSQREWDMTIYDAIIDANALIYNRRMVNANWIVASSDVCTRLEKLEGFTEVHRDWAVSSMGMERFGVLKNRFNVIKDPWAPANSLLMGYKGNTMMETGYIYAPYRPLYMSPTIIDTNDFTPRRGIMSRYARKLVDPGFYASVTVV